MIPPSFFMELRHDPRACDVRGIAKALAIEPAKTEQKKFVCPRHQGGSLNLRLGPDGTLQAKCFGGCGFQGDVIGLVREVNRCDVLEAVRWLAEHCGRTDIVEALEKKPEQQREQEQLPRERYAEIALAFVELCGHMPKDVFAYLEERKIAGYAEALGCIGVPTKQDDLVRALLTRFPRRELELGGFLLKKHDRLFCTSCWKASADCEHRLGIVWRRRDGSIADIQRRLLRAPTEDETKILFSPRSTGRRDEPFAAHAFAEAVDHAGDADVVVTEGALDTAARMTLAMHRGERLLVLGAASVSDWRIDWTPFVKGRRVRVAFDATKDGDYQAPFFAELVGAYGAREVVRERPLAKDWNEVLIARSAA